MKSKNLCKKRHKTVFFFENLGSLDFTQTLGLGRYAPFRMSKNGICLMFNSNNFDVDSFFRHVASAGLAVRREAKRC